MNNRKKIKEQQRALKTKRLVQQWLSQRDKMLSYENQRVKAGQIDVGQV
jgi:hypothetical protein